MSWEKAQQGAVNVGGYEIETLLSNFTVHNSSIPYHQTVLDSCTQFYCHLRTDFAYGKSVLPNPLLFDHVLIPIDASIHLSFCPSALTELTGDLLRISPLTGHENNKIEDLEPGTEYRFRVVVYSKYHHPSAISQVTAL